MKESEALRFLTPHERSILDDWLKNSTKPKISIDTSLRMYELFLQGCSMQEICELNKNVFSMGQLLNARVQQEWDERKLKHLDHLYGTIVQKVAQVQSEGISFIADVMAMQHKLYSTKIREYLQTGDESKLDGVPMEYRTATGYRKIIDSLMKITGQDKQKDKLDERVPKNQQPPSERDDVGIGVPVKALPAGATPAVPASAAAQILKALDKMGIGNN